MRKLLFCTLIFTFFLFDVNSQTLSYPFTNGSLAGLTHFGTALTQTTDRINSTTDAVDLNGDYLRTTGTYTDFSFTMSFWVNTTTVDGTKRTIIDHSNKNSNFDNNSDAGWYTYLKNGKVGLAANYWHTHDVSGSPVVAYSGYAYTESTTNIADGYWHNVIVTAQKSIIYTGSSEKRYVYNIYVDGVLENTQTVSRFTSSMTNVNAGLVITAKAMTIANNNSSNLTDRYLDNIDDIKYYNSVVSSTVINTLANENRCNTPTNITFNSITSSSVDIDWNQNTDALSWDMIYVPTGQPMGNGVLTSSISVSNYSLTGLTQNTTYDVYIKSNCNGFSGWWSVPNAFTTLCPSAFVNAAAQNFTLQLNSSGTGSITTSNINNGSSVDCGIMNLSLSKTNFNCSDVGVNSVTLTATDNQGHVSTATANVTVLGLITNVPLSVSQSSICSGNTTTITTSSSDAGVKYYLRNDATNAVVSGPVIGTGSALSFSTGSLSANTTFNVYAETPGGGNYGLDFDGTNDVITTTLQTVATSSLTIEAWVFPRATVYKRIISNYKGSATQSGEIILDTYNATNNGRGLRFVVEGAGNSLHQLSTPNVLTLNAWNHVAGTFSNGVTTLYVNGIQVATNTATFTSIPSCTNTMTMGEDPTIGSAEYFNGKIDEVRIWNAARTQAELAGNMNNCLAGNENGLVTYFKFSENSGSTITDLVSGATGTMSGMDPATDWVIGNVDCGGTCPFEMTNLITVTVNATPTVAVNSGNVCSGSSFTMVPSGASTYTFQGGNAIITPTANASYTVTGTSVAGCVSSTFATSNVTVNALPVISVNSGSICSGNSFTMVPTGASTYTFQGGSAVKTPTATASYTVVGTNAAGCVSQGFATSNVTVNALPIIAVNSGSICSGSSFTMIPSGANTYTFQGGSSVKTPTANASYTVTGTSVAGCTSSTFATSNVTVVASPTVIVNSGSICAGGSFTIAPSGASSYTFQGGSAIVSPTTTSSYTVAGTNATGCVSSPTAVSNITVNPIPVISLAGGAICPGNSFTLSPTGASTYTYSSGSPVVSPASTTSYTVSGTSAAGCESSTSAVATITVSGTLTITITGNNTVCSGQAINLTAGGATTYTWNTGATASTIAPTPTANATYSVIGASGSCTNTAVTNITVNSLPNVSASTNNTLICSGQTATLTANGASTYTWSTAENTSNINVSPLTQTTYTVEGTGANGCVNSAVITQSVSVCTDVNSLVNNTNQISIYPNPFNEKVIINAELNYSDVESTIDVYNTLGSLVYTTVIKEEKTEIDLRNQAMGVYFINVTIDRVTSIHKVIKQ